MLEVGSSNLLIPTKHVLERRVPFRRPCGDIIDGDLGFGNTVEPVCGLDDPNFNDAVDKGKAQGGNQ